MRDDDKLFFNVSLQVALLQKRQHFRRSKKGRYFNFSRNVFKSKEKCGTSVLLFPRNILVPFLFENFG